MRRISQLLLLLPVLSAVPARAEDMPRVKAAAELQRFYRERLNRPFLRTDDTPEEKVGPPPWAGPLKDLASGKPAERSKAAEYLRELLDLALEHQSGRTAPWRNTPFWGVGAEVPARDLRKEVASELARAGALPDAVPVFRWYFDSEKVDAFLPPVLGALGKVDGKEADALRAELATKPHPNAVIAAGAIDQIAARRGSLPGDRLASLCHHHRSAVREAARKLNTQQGGKDPGPFDPAKAVRSEPVRKVMDDVLALMPDLPAPKAEFVTMTVRCLDEKKVAREKSEETGWLVRKDKDLVEVYTPYGRRELARPGERKRIKHSEKAPEGKGRVTSEIEVTVDVTVVPAYLDNLLKEVEASRANNMAGLDLSRRGALTGQFEGGGATLFETTLGTWLYRAGRDADAARVLLPALDSLFTDRRLPEMVRHRLGELAGYRMLIAFAGDRDYAIALKEARQIDRLYPDTQFHKYAKGLAEQLPRRTDDFTKFKLPTPAEWTDLKKTMTRNEQIDFLCGRLRLLNCFQEGQPGGYDPGETQYAEPCGLAADASWGLRRGKTKVINPLTELNGPLNWYGDKDRPNGLDLTMKDVPGLSKHLRDDWYMPIVSFWRDFHPDRNLSSTRPQVAELVNGLAGKDVCRIEAWDRLTPAGVDREIARINKWATDNAGKTKVELQWEALREELAAGAEWTAIENRVERLLEQKEVGAYDVMRKFLDDSRTDGYARSNILRTYLAHDVTRVKDLAPKFLDDKRPAVREAAALVMLRTDGDRVRARAIVGDALTAGELDSVLADAVGELLKDGSEESRRQVARVFANGGLAAERNGSRVQIFKTCAVAGMLDPYQFYLRMLDNTFTTLPIKNQEGTVTGTAYYSPSVAEEFAEEIVNQFAPADAMVKEIAKKFPKSADRVAPLKEWLRGHLDKAKN